MNYRRRFVFLALPLVLAACGDHPTRVVPADISFTYSDSFASSFSSSFHSYDSTTGKTIALGGTFGTVASTKKPANCKVAASADELAQFEIAVEKSTLF